MHAEKHTIALTTDGSGDVTGYSPVVTGRILSVIYDKTDFADGVDFTITLEDTGENIWTEANVNAATVRAPRQATHGVDGSASLFAAAGEPVESWIVAVNDRVKVVVAQGGDTKSGNIVIIVG